MPCHQLRTHSGRDSTWSVSTCGADNSLYVPSLAEQARYCRSGSHRDCPLYCQARVYEKPLRPAEYGRCSFSPLLRAA
ncbi:hypothetical protein ACHHRT_11195 [Desulfurivibrio sp. D14AmB]|uniref:hypothetical protein n=1 Tax=Desulfurivibrio sp. D14AmB TaxID=3374370 RepID=UPI00376EB0C3